MYSPPFVHLSSLSVAFWISSEELNYVKVISVDIPLGVLLCPCVRAPVHVRESVMAVFWIQSHIKAYSQIKNEGLAYSYAQTKLWVRSSPLNSY